MRRGLPVVFAALACALTIGGPPALAEEPRRPVDLRKACQADFEAMCPDVGSEAERDEIVGCLKEHESKLSKHCRQALSAPAKRAGAGPCRDQIEQLCPDVRDRRAMRECVEEHRDELSEECRQMRSKRSGRRKGGDRPGGMGRGRGW